MIILGNTEFTVEDNVKSTLFEVEFDKSVSFLIITRDMSRVALVKLVRRHETSSLNEVPVVWVEELEDEDPVISLSALHGRPPNMKEKDIRIMIGDVLGELVLVGIGVGDNEIIGVCDGKSPLEIIRKHTSC